MDDKTLRMLMWTRIYAHEISGKPISDPNSARAASVADHAIRAMEYKFGIEPLMLSRTPEQAADIGRLELSLADKFKNIPENKITREIDDEGLEEDILSE